MKLWQMISMILTVGYASLQPAAIGEMDFDYFEGLGDLPGGRFFSQAYDVSGDGSVVVGRSVNSDGFVAFRWTEESGMQPLGDLGANPVGAAYAISGDGSAIVGYGYSDDGLEAYRWTEATGMVGIGDLPEGEFKSIALDVSWDGTVVVGNGQSKKGPEAFIWKPDVGMKGLGDLQGGSHLSYAGGVSGNGMRVAGTSDSHDGFEAFIWPKKEKFLGLQRNKMEDIDEIPGGNSRSVTAAISADGSTVVGHSDTAYGTKAFHWTQESGMKSLGDLQGGFSMAADVSANGACVVGFAEGTNGITAFVWNEGGDMQSLRAALIYSGVTNVSGWHLMHAEGISDDGKTIVGYGTNPDGKLEAFRCGRY